MDFESISYRLVSFRGTAPTPQDIESEFCEYAKNHLIFVYEHNGRKWAQFDTSNAGAKDWKTSVDLKSPMPPDEPYCEWLKEQHGDQWKKFHWYNPAHKTKGIKQVPAWASLSLAKDLTKSQPSHDQGSALGLGSGLGLGIGKKKELKPSARKARGADERYVPFVDALSKYWEFKNPTLKFEMSNADGKQLKNFLADHREVSLEQFKKCLNHRARSDMVHSQAISRWIGRTLEFIDGPLNEFWKPIGGNGNGNGTSKARRIQDESLDAIRTAINRIDGQDAGGAEGGISKPEHNSRNGTVVPDGIRTDFPGSRPGTTRKGDSFGDP